jgi:general stress protein YciG
MANSKRGFAGMDKAKQKEIARKGGQARRGTSSRSNQEGS